MGYSRHHVYVFRSKVDVACDDQHMCNVESRISVLCRKVGGLLSEFAGSSTSTGRN